VIVLIAVDGVEDLPVDYDNRLNDASQTKLHFYIAAEINNMPWNKAPWKFTVGDGRDHGDYSNRELERGQVYIVHQRAITRKSNVSKLESTQ